MFWCYTDETNRTAGEDDENLRDLLSRNTFIAMGTEINEGTKSRTR